MSSIRRLMLASLAIALGVASAEAHAQGCQLGQVTVTTTGDSRNPDLSGDGALLAFKSSSDLTGGNGDGNEEVFVYDLGTGSFQQRTSSTGGGFSDLPSQSTDGNEIAFVSNKELVPLGNADGNREVFLLAPGVPNLTQITDTVGGANQRPKLAGDGNRIAFLSDHDLMGNGKNADGNTEVFVHDRSGSGSFQQITVTTGGFNGDLAMGRDGEWVSFVSTSNQTGDNGDGSQEAFVARADGSAIGQISRATVGFSFDTSIDADGSRVAFSSTSDLVGGNADGNGEIFLYDDDTGAIQQITNTTGCESNSAQIDDAGMRIAFVTQCTIGGGNPDGGPDLALWEEGAGIRFVTENPGFGSISTPTISGNGTRLGFRTSVDLLGQNPDGNFEIFMAECPAIQPAPTVIPGLVVGALLAACVWNWAPRRR